MEESEQEGSKEPKPSVGQRMFGFARAHPGLSIAAAAFVGLFGGVEVAAGVLFGAGITALVGGRDGETAKKLRERARDVVHAARGEHVETPG